MLVILSNIPLWVMPLLALLVWLGLRATRDRETSVWPFYGLPLLGINPLITTAGLAQAELALMAFAGGYVATVVAGYALQARWIAGRDGYRVTLRGEWLSLVTFLGIFSANFVNGALQGGWPQIAATSAFAVGFGLALGALSGLFLGRGLRVLTWAEPIPA